MNKGKLYIICLLILWINPGFCGIIDSLEIELADPKKDNQTYFDLSSALGSEYLQKFNYLEAIKYLELADSLAKKLNLKSEKFQNLVLLGSTYFSLSEYEKATAALQLVLANGESYLTDKEIANLYTQMAKTKQALGEHDKAYDYQLSSLSIREAIKDSIGIAQSQYEIGTIFFYQTNYDLALKFYNKSLEMCEALNNQGLIYSCLGAIGGTHGRIGKTEIALEYNLKAYQLAKEINYGIGLAYAAHNIGGNYETLGEYDKALEYLNQSMEFKIANNDKWGQVNGLILLAKSYRGLGKFEESITELEKAKELAEEINSKPRMIEVYEALSQIYAESNKYKEAYYYADIYNDIKDSLLNAQTLESINAAQSKYEVLQKEVELLKKEGELVSFYRIGGTVLGIFLLLLVWLGFSKYKTQKTFNAKLARSHKQISAQKKALEIAYKKQETTNSMLVEKHRQIEFQNHRLAHSNSELQRFAYIASHDLKEPLRNIGSYASLLKRRYAAALNTEAKEFMDFITKGVDKMYNLLNDVLEYSKIENDELLLQSIDVNEVIKVVVANLKLQIIEKNVEIITHNLPPITANKVHLIQLFQNLVSNGIKYSNKANPKIEIKGERHEFEILFSIKDNGIGMDMEYKDKVFEIFQRLHGEEEYGGTGVGLAICKKIVNQYGGAIWLDSVPGVGSTFYFTLPIDSKKNIFELEAYAS